MYIVINAYKFTVFEILIDFLYLLSYCNTQLQTLLLWQLHDYPSHANSKNAVVLNYLVGG